MPNKQLVEAVASRLVSTVFGLTQPDRGDVFGWFDDNSTEVATATISATIDFLSENVSEEMHLFGLRAMVKAIEEMQGPIPPLKNFNKETMTADYVADELAQRYMKLGATMRTSYELVESFRAMLAVAKEEGQ